MKRFFYSIFFMWYLLPANTTFAYTRSDSLKGSNGSGRNWWDVQHYELNIMLDTAKQTIEGENIMLFKIVGKAPDTMQIDLQDSMVLDYAMFDKERINIVREGNVYWLKYPFSKWKPGTIEKIRLGFHGKPRIAKNPPWNGGFVWSQDAWGKPWIAVACQGIGASVWWPCKDIQSDEPDNGVNFNMTVPNGLVCVSNGRLLEEKKLKYNYTEWHWQVKNPINTYDITFYVGDYTQWADTLKGEKGRLDINYYVLNCNLEKAKKQFEVVKPMLHCFEYWMGPYPFYEDGYKLVDDPYLGMEHQSAVAYGNEYKMGYKGTDRSKSGVGLLFDYIIVHESGHEWFGNNVTASDVADNWIHEGITTFSETLFAECMFGKEKAAQFCKGEWGNISNNAPIIGDYDVSKGGSHDEYDKGTAIMFMIRKMMNNDEKFRKMLRSINEKYFHGIVSTNELEQYISKQSGINLSAFFNQYLRTKDIPELEYYIKKKELYYRFNDAVPGFSLPIEISNGKKSSIIKPTSEWQHINWSKGYNLSFSDDFLIKVK